MRKVITFDLDDTLAVTKSPITDKMARLLEELLEHHQVCIISGGRFEQFQKQVIDNLKIEHHFLLNLHIMPTCGTRYYRFNDIDQEWKLLYAEDIPQKDKQRIIDALTRAAKETGFLEKNPHGEIVEDRGSQITFSACGQQAPPEVKYKWDPDTKKRQKIREKVIHEIDDYEIRIGGTTSIDVTKPGIDKAYGMEKLMSVLEIGKDDILFIGDKLEEGGNDYPVKAMGIDTIAVEGWEDAALVIETINKLARNSDE
ncbi:MAG: HAD-IIB family hydrolase [Candidatus Saccharibacteria bacterium]|nr:HAD-IIB family hydrolase [Candidatus Saccharibacteria bacterium]